jgi:hypothetical protein
METKFIGITLTDKAFVTHGASAATGGTDVVLGEYTPFIDFRNWTELRMFAWVSNTGNLGDIQIEYSLDGTWLKSVILEERFSTTNAVEDDRVWERPIPPFIRFRDMGVSGLTKNIKIFILGRKNITEDDDKYVMATVPIVTSSTYNDIVPT